MPDLVHKKKIQKNIFYIFQSGLLPKQGKIVHSMPQTNTFRQYLKKYWKIKRSLYCSKSCKVFLYFTLCNVSRFLVTLIRWSHEEVDMRKKEIYIIFIKPVKTPPWDIHRYAKVNRFILYWSQFRMTNSKCGGNGKRAKKCISPERSCLVSDIIFSVICLQSNDRDISAYIRQFYTFMFSTISDLLSPDTLQFTEWHIQGDQSSIKYTKLFRVNHWLLNKKNLILSFQEMSNHYFPWY